MTQVFRITLVLIPLHNVVLPTPSSKVVKYLISSGQLFPSLKPLVFSRDKYKPLFISNLGLNGKRIIERNREINANIPLKASISFSGIDPSSLISEASKEGKFSTTYGEFYISVDNVEIVDINELKQEIEKNLDKNINVVFRSPAILSSKLLLPPSAKERFEDIDVGFSPLPSVGLISAHAYNIYCNVIGKKEIENRAFKLGVLSNALSRVVGYNLRPVTAVIGEDSKGRPRYTRGVVGWIKFDIPYEKLKISMLKYLIVASYLGIGRSRGIGFGEIEVSFRPREENSHR